MQVIAAALEQSRGFGPASHSRPSIRARRGARSRHACDSQCRVGTPPLRVIRVDRGAVTERLLLGDGAWIGYVNLVPVVIAFGEEAVMPQPRETIMESAFSADAGRMMSPGSEEAIRP